ncbi:VOC family protein [Tsuneonella mangrovi]|uniref:VOC family protein n=1 Tax=Tsuneonella mangrovi TaxID=1982042 RepID=UPI000BA1D605|nr:VOC family protein [Tsuneonella mangrovi]
MGDDRGAFIWYELMTPDPAGAKAFYDAVVGWDIDAENSVPDGTMDYRMINRSDGGFAGGVLGITQEMNDHGARAGWFGYVHVLDVDAAACAVTDAGGTIQMGPMDMAGVGRMAMVADPQGAPLYLMTPTPPPDNPDAESDVWAENEPQRCAWNELATADPSAAIELYTALFGWSLPEPMDMGPMGKYQFIAHDGMTIGAIFGKPETMPDPAWTYYFRVPSITAAIYEIAKGGGQVTTGPHEVPGGDHIVQGIDPQGAPFALVGALKE